MNIIERYVTNNPCYNGAGNFTPKGLMLHSVGASNPSGESWCAQYDSSTAQACVHAFIDANTGTIYQTLPWNHIGWHSGGAGNDTHIGVEMCESDNITYDPPGGTFFNVDDAEKARTQAETAYNAAVELFAFLCKEYNIDPTTQICSHSEGYTKGIASNHADCEHYWKGLGLSYTMDGFRAAVYAKLHGSVHSNEYDSQGRIILRDSQGTQMSMYRFFQLSLKPPDEGGAVLPGNPPEKWGGYSGHLGYDFSAPRNTEIRSTCTGKVVVYRGGITQEGNSSDWGGMGNSVIIEETGQTSGTTRYHRYMHMISDPVVQLNDVVEQGTLLGYVGSTGDSTGPHLHYDIQLGLWGTTVDAWEQFNNDTQPDGWTPSNIAIFGSWSSIEDSSGIDYGPYRTGGGGGGTVVIDGIPVLIPAKQIFWDPIPGTILKSNTVISISTDAENANIYYTTDNAVPTVQSRIYKKASGISKTNWGRNLFIRARAITENGEVIAQGSACYGWVWDSTEPDPANKIEFHQEVNQRPYLKYEDPVPPEQTSNTHSD